MRSRVPWSTSDLLSPIDPYLLVPYRECAATSS
jgi:hypothetical protein